jgi:hypothetical protein
VDQTSLLRSGPDQVHRISNDSYQVDGYYNRIPAKIALPSGRGRSFRCGHLRNANVCSLLAPRVNLAWAKEARRRERGKEDLRHVIHTEFQLPWSMLRHHDCRSLGPRRMRQVRKCLKLSGANTKSVNTNDGPYDIPDWAEHKNLYGLDYHAETGVVSSTYEFERELKKTVQGTAGTPYGVEFSLSDSVTTFNSQMNSHESS